MSAQDLALFLRQKMGEKKATNVEMVRRTKISRRTWYRLLSADIEEAKLSTLVKLASALDTSVAHLVHLYFQSHRSKHRLIQETVKTNLPSNSLVKTEQSFTKAWEISNQSRKTWKNLTLRCIDDALDIRFHEDNNTGFQPVSTLKSERREVSIAETKVGDTVSISIDFVAPNTIGTTMSHWRFFDGDKQMLGKAFPKLDCLVKVIE